MKQLFKLHSTNKRQTYRVIKEIQFRSQGQDYFIPEGTEASVSIEQDAPMHLEFLVHFADLDIRFVWTHENFLKHFHKSS